MSRGFLKDKRRFPTNYDIAIQYFFNKSYGVFFNPERVRHDKDPKTHKEYIDELIRDSMKYFLD